MGKAEQHRHYWITVVVWLAYDKCPDDLGNFSHRGISYSTGPGTFDTKRTGTRYFSENGTGPETHPKLIYAAGQAITLPDIGPDNALRPPLVGWSRLPQATKDQFNGTQYENTKVPFSDANFQGFLDTAYDDAFFVGVPDAMDCASPSLTAPAPDPSPHEKV